MKWETFFSKRKSNPYLAGIFSGDYAFIGPMKVAICPTNRCNNNCIACWLKSPFIKDCEEQFQDKEIPFAILEDFVNRVYRLGAKYIIITGGGEPFLYPQINELIAKIKSYNMTCDINTNLISLTDKEILTLVKNKVDLIIASIWAGTAESYELLHPGKKVFFYRIRDNLKMLSRLKREHNVSYPRITITNVIMSLNFDKLEEMVEFALEVGVQSIMFNLVHVHREETRHLLLNEKQAKLTLELVDKCKSEMEKRRREGKTAIEFDLLPQFIKRLKSPRVSTGQYDRELVPERCYAGWSFFQLKPDGRFTSCCRVDNTRGNIYQDRIEDVWNGKSQREFRRTTLNLKENIEKHRLPCYELCDNLHDIWDIEKLFREYPQQPKKIIFISKLCGNLMKLLQFIRRQRHRFIKSARSYTVKLSNTLP